MVFQFKVGDLLEITPRFENGNLRVFYNLVTNIEGNLVNLYRLDSQLLTPVHQENISIFCRRLLLPGWTLKVYRKNTLLFHGFHPEGESVPIELPVGKKVL